MDKADHALIALGRVHAYTTFLCKLGLLDNSSVDEFCHRVWERRPEIQMRYEDAVKEALVRRGRAFDRSKGAQGS